MNVYSSKAFLSPFLDFIRQKTKEQLGLLCVLGDRAQLLFMRKRQEEEEEEEGDGKKEKEEEEQLTFPRSASKLCNAFKKEES